MTDNLFLSSDTSNHELGWILYKQASVHFLADKLEEYIFETNRMNLKFAKDFHDADSKHDAKFSEASKYISRLKSKLSSEFALDSSNQGYILKMPNSKTVNQYFIDQTNKLVKNLNEAWSNYDRLLKIKNKIKMVCLKNMAFEFYYRELVFGNITFAFRDGTWNEKPLEQVNKGFLRRFFTQDLLCAIANLSYCTICVDNRGGSQKLSVYLLNEQGKRIKETRSIKNQPSLF